MKKRKAWIGLVSSLAVGAVATVLTFVAFIFSEDFNEGGASEPAMATVDSEIEGEEAEQAEEIEKETPISEKYVELNEEFEINGLHIVIEDVEIDEKYVTIGVSARNESDNTKSFYPSQGDIIIGSKQMNSNFLMNKGDSWGDIHSGVIKSGTLRYVADEDGLNPAEITEIRLVYGSVRDLETYESEEFDEVVNLD